MPNSGQITPAAKFRSDVTVELVRSAAEDSDVVWSARVSTAGEKSLEAQSEDPNASKGLINFLMKNRHGTPFEHNSMTFMISAPIFVFREFHRHRVGWSYNEERLGTTNSWMARQSSHESSMRRLFAPVRARTRPTNRCLTLASLARLHAESCPSTRSRRCMQRVTRVRSCRF